MDADWTTALVALPGFTSTLWATERGHNRARAAAREQRTQDRLAAAYVEVLQIAESVGHWAQTIIPMYDTGQPEPPLPPLADQTGRERWSWRSAAPRSLPRSRRGPGW